MIQLSKTGKHFGARTLFENLDWLIGPKDRIGLVGANGTGKSTLLKILCELESADTGAISRMRGITGGYLPQEGLSLKGRTIFAECMTVFSDLRGMENEMEALTRQMSELDPESQDYLAVTERYHTLESTFVAYDGYSLEAQVGAVLSGLGFAKDDWDRPTEEFSGGWQMRIALAKLLLEKPNLLLLDEPTNHLDIEARNWLEEYLSNYPHAFVLISHDRYFLDVTVKKIVELWNLSAHFYTGNYTKFLELKTMRREQLIAAQKSQRERIDQLEAFITRFRYQATKAKQVQSRIKELEKIDRIQIPAEEKTIHFRFPQPKPGGRIVAEFKGVSKSYGGHEVFAGVNFLIERGDRIALVGVNGAGKSTLMKLLAVVEPLTAGEYRLGHNVDPNYFAQDQYRELDPDSNLLADLSTVAPNWTMTQLRSLLGSFLFSADDAEKRIGVLSGGERNRYALARLLVSPSNFLLLDEPTNHLDMRAKDVLLSALESYTGTVVFVSHDRYFIDKLAARVFEVATGEVTIYSGSYEDYLRRKEGLELAEQGVEIAAPTLADVPGLEPAGDRKRRLNPQKVRQMQGRCEEIEEEVLRLEAEIAETEGELAVFRSAEETEKVTARLSARQKRLEHLTVEWEELTEYIGE